jgi:hypothetical protein
MTDKVLADKSTNTDPLPADDNIAQVPVVTAQPAAGNLGPITVQTTQQPADQSCLCWTWNSFTFCEDNGPRKSWGQRCCSAITVATGGILCATAASVGLGAGLFSALGAAATVETSKASILIGTGMGSGGCIGGTLGACVVGAASLTFHSTQRPPYQENMDDTDGEYSIGLVPDPFGVAPAAAATSYDFMSGNFLS